MSNEQKERTLDDIEEKIYDFEALEPEIWFEVGELLTAAKKLLGHGKLEKWFDGCKFSFCRATRANRMAYYRDMLGRRDFAQAVNLSKLRARMRGEASGFSHFRKRVVRKK